MSKNRKEMGKKVRAVIAGIALSIVTITTTLTSIEAYALTPNGRQITQNDFLKAEGGHLKNRNNQVVALRGVNAGGWLIQESWMCPINGGDRAWANLDTINTLKNRGFTDQQIQTLFDTYQDNWFTTIDLDNVKAMGVNCVRVPFWYRNFMSDENGTWITGNDLDNNPGIKRLDWVIEECGKRGMYVILDCHGAPGGQSMDHCCGTLCKNELYDSSKNRAILKDLWTKIATRYKDNPVVAAYDILNEPQNNGGYNGANAWAPGSNEALSRTYSVYDEMYKAIRAVDPDHVISMEAIWSGNCLPDPRNYGWSNLLYQMHIYDTSIDMIDTRVNELKYYQSEYGVAVYAGEFNCDPNEEYAMKKFNEAGINWTTWAYKGAKQGVGNNWFLYVKNIPYVDAYADSYETILNKWGSVLKTSNFDVNEGTVKRWIMNHVNGAVADQGNSGVAGQGQGEATLADGEYFFEAVDSGKIVCADNAGNDPLVANKDSYGGAWETINVVNNSDNTISLKSGANDKYVCAVIDENNQLLARSASIGTWEKFNLIKVSDTEYALKACANNKFVCVDQDNGNVLYADRDSISGWESFHIYKTNGSQTNVDSDNSDNSSNQGTQSSSIVANGEYYLVASNGKVICAEDTEGSSLIANRDSYGGAWETFTIVNNDDNTISLKSGTNGNYVCAVIDEQNQLVPRSTSIGTWEKFYLERLSSGNFALKSCANDKYVCADQNNNNTLYADRDSAGGWETFQIYTTSGDFVE